MPTRGCFANVTLSISSLDIFKDNEGTGHMTEMKAKTTARTPRWQFDFLSPSCLSACALLTPLPFMCRNVSPPFLYITTEGPSRRPPAQFLTIYLLVAQDDSALHLPSSLPSAPLLCEGAAEMMQEMGGGWGLGDHPSSCFSVQCPHLAGMRSKFDQFIVMCVAALHKPLGSDYGQVLFVHFATQAHKRRPGVSLQATGPWILNMRAGEERESESRMSGGIGLKLSLENRGERSRFGTLSWKCHSRPTICT